MNSDSMFPASWRVILNSRVVWLWAGLCALGNLLSSSIDASSWERGVDIKSLVLGILLCQLPLVGLIVNYVGYSGVLVTVSGIELGKTPTLKESWVLVKQKWWRVLVILILSTLLAGVVALPVLIAILVIAPPAQSGMKMGEFMFSFINLSSAFYGVFAYFAILAHVIDHEGVFSSIGKAIRVIARNLGGSVGFIFILAIVNLLPMLLCSTLAHLLDGVPLTEIIGWRFMMGAYHAGSKPVFQIGMALVNFALMPFLWSVATTVYLHFTGRSRLGEESVVEAA